MIHRHQHRRMAEAIGFVIRPSLDVRKAKTDRLAPSISHDHPRPRHVQGLIAGRGCFQARHACGSPVQEWVAVRRRFSILTGKKPRSNANALGIPASKDLSVIISDMKPPARCLFVEGRGKVTSATWRSAPPNAREQQPVRVNLGDKFIGDVLVPDHDLNLEVDSVQ